MLIVCPACASSYNIDDAKIGVSGRTVRCASCRHSFFVSLPKPDEMFEAESLRGAADDFTAAMASEVSAEQAADRVAMMPETSPGREPAQAAEADKASSPESTSDSHVPISDVASRGPQFDAMASREFMPEPKPVVQGKLMRLVSMVIAPIRLIPPSLASAAFAVLLTGGLIVERVDVVRLFPETARLYAAVGYTVNLRGLTFRNIVTELVQEGEARVLVIEGDIANAEERTISVPLISVSVQGEDGAQLYTWTSEPQRPKLAAGDLMRFRARLVSPPPQGKNVLVRFAGRESNNAPPAVKHVEPEMPPQPTRGNVKEFR
jgi:predicted Zn finger-like uncharacterized protein